MAAALDHAIATVERDLRNLPADRGGDARLPDDLGALVDAAQAALASRGPEAESCDTGRERPSRRQSG